MTPSPTEPSPPPCALPAHEDQDTSRDDGAWALAWIALAGLAWLAFRLLELRGRPAGVDWGWGNPTLLSRIHQLFAFALTDISLVDIGIPLLAIGFWRVWLGSEGLTTRLRRASWGVAAGMVLATAIALPIGMSWQKLADPQRIAQYYQILEPGLIAGPMFTPALLLTLVVVIVGGLRLASIHRNTGSMFLTAAIGSLLYAVANADAMRQNFIDTVSALGLWTDSIGYMQYGATKPERALAETPYSTYVVNLVRTEGQKPFSVLMRLGVWWCFAGTAEVLWRYRGGVRAALERARVLPAFLGARRAASTGSASPDARGARLAPHPLRAFATAASAAFLWIQLRTLPEAGKLPGSLFMLAVLLGTPLLVLANTACVLGFSTQQERERMRSLGVFALGLLVQGLVCAGSRPGGLWTYGPGVLVIALLAGAASIDFLELRRTGGANPEEELALATAREVARRENEALRSFFEIRENPVHLLGQRGKLTMPWSPLLATLAIWLLFVPPIVLVSNKGGYFGVTNASFFPALVRGLAEARPGELARVAGFTSTSLAGALMIGALAFPFMVFSLPEDMRRVQRFWERDTIVSLHMTRLRPWEAFWGLAFARGGALLLPMSCTVALAAASYLLGEWLNPGTVEADWRWGAALVPWAWIVFALLLLFALAQVIGILVSLRSVAVLRHPMVNGLLVTALPVLLIVLTLVVSRMRMPAAFQQLLPPLLPATLFLLLHHLVQWVPRGHARLLGDD